MHLIQNMLIAKFYLKLIFNCLIISLTSFTVVFGMLYCCGRWQIIFLNETIGSRVVGFINLIFLCALILNFLKEKKIRNNIFIYGFSLILFSILLLIKPDLLTQKIYIRGLKDAAFNAASPEQWRSALTTAEEYRMNPFKSQAWGWELLPHFAWKVFPGKGIYTGILDKADQTNDLHVLIFWRGVSFTPAIIIGHTNSLPSEGLSLSVAHQEGYSNDILFMILNDK